MEFLDNLIEILLRMLVVMGTLGSMLFGFLCFIWVIGTMFGLEQK